MTLSDLPPPPSPQTASSNGESPAPAPAPVPISAKPDMQSAPSPSGSNKVKLLHLEGGDGDGDGDGNVEGATDKDAEVNGEGDVRMEETSVPAQVGSEEERVGRGTGLPEAAGSSAGSGREGEIQVDGTEIKKDQSSSPVTLNQSPHTDTDGLPRQASGPSAPNGAESASESEFESDADDEKDEKDPQHTVQAIPLAEELEVQEEWWDLKLVWAGKSFDLHVGGNDMVYDFRQLITRLTGVSVEGQKLIGLLPGARGKLGVEHDSKRFGTLGVKKGGKFVLVGTREDDKFKDRMRPNNEVTDNFDVTYSNKVNQATAVTPAEDPRNKRKIKEIIERVPITVMNEPREGKKLLVLDLDYTIVDTRPLIDGALPSEECARPGMHEFLEKVYPHYDIVVWSQTHWRWLETKLAELGILGGDRNYKIAFVADRTTMFPVFTQRHGEPYKHEVKPLAYFWATFPQWSAKNTIHIDDLARNFALNPGEGLRIRAFNKAGQPEGLNDRELWRLGTYLVNIATGTDDFTTLDHSRWKHTVPRQ